MAKVMLNYTFHNPNTVEDTVEMLLQFFVEVNKPKVEEAIKIAMEEHDETVNEKRLLEKGRRSL